MLRINTRAREFQTYQDGWGTSWETKGRKMLQVRQQVIHFSESAVGERRYWDAQVAGREIKRALLVPEASRVEQGDIFEISGEQFLVEQKDRRDTAPVSWLLSLSKPPVLYNKAVEGGEGNG